MKEEDKDYNSIIINDNNQEDERPVDIPVITIESAPPASDNLKEALTVIRRGRRRRYLWLALALAVLVVTAAILWRYRFYFIDCGITSSVSDKENRELLSASSGPVAQVSGVEVVTDSILGVAFNAYPLQGLRASLEQSIPDTADNSVVLVMRSADYHPDGSTIGTMVVNGEKLPAKERRTRPAYLAISKDGIPVIGISLTDAMSDFTARQGGSFFRQFAILGNGELPSSFALHGKVERGAIGRMADGSLHYFLTRHRESMYDFADALREYGVVDAIYITGGNGYEFYRDTKGAPHISDNLRDHFKKYADRKTSAPLLVFRNQ